MKLSDIEDADKLVTKDWLDVRVRALEDRIAVQFHQEMLRVLMWLVSIQVTIALGILGGVYFMLSHWKP
jgi:hypothetical protein